MFQVNSDHYIPNSADYRIYREKNFSEFLVFFRPSYRFRLLWFRISWFQVNPDLYFPNTAVYRIYQENDFSEYWYFFDQHIVFDYTDSEFLGFRSILIIIFRIPRITEFFLEIIFHIFNILSTSIRYSMTLIPNFLVYG